MNILELISQLIGIKTLRLTSSIMKFSPLRLVPLKELDFLTHGFKNRTGERTGKGSGSRINGLTGVRSVVEPVTS